MRRFIVPALLSLVISHAIFLPQTARAGLITINETFDIAGQLGGVSITRAITTRSIASGDSVDMTVNFAPGKALRIGDGNEQFHAWLTGIGSSSAFTIQNIVVEFLGFTGTGGAASSLASASETNGTAHIGPFFNNFLSAGQAIQFTGFRARYDVAGLDVDPNTYSSIWLLETGLDVSVVDVPVPVAPTLALFGLGVVGLGWSRRRKA